MPNIFSFSFVGSRAISFQDVHLESEHILLICMAQISTRPYYYKTADISRWLVSRISSSPNYTYAPSYIKVINKVFKIFHLYSSLLNFERIFLSFPSYFSPPFTSFFFFSFLQPSFKNFSFKLYTFIRAGKNYFSLISRDSIELFTMGI